jgi:hypothetical protein
MRQCLTFLFPCRSRVSPDATQSTYSVSNTPMASVLSGDEIVSRHVRLVVVLTLKLTFEGKDRIAK